MSKKRTPPSDLRAELKQQQPAVLRAIDLEVSTLRDKREALAARLRALGFVGDEADRLKVEIDELDQSLDGCRQERDHLRIELHSKLQEIVRPYLMKKAPGLIEAARLIREAADVLSEVDRFMTENSPPWAESGYYRSLPSPDRLIALAESLAGEKK